MTAIAVLSLIVIVLSTLLSVVTDTWLVAAGSVDNYNKSRVMLGVLDRDVRTMVLRSDVAAFPLDKNAQYPAFAFYTKVQGSPGSDTRAVSLIQYVLTSTTTSSVLERLDYGLNFPPVAPATNPALTLSLNNTTSLPDLANFNATSQTESLATGVIAFQWQFVDGGGNVLNPPYTTPSATDAPSTATTPFWFDFTNPSASYNPRGVIVSLVVLSNGGYNIAANSGTIIPTLQTIFSSSSGSLATGQTFSQYWNSILKAPTPQMIAMPAPVRTGLQVFERHIQLPLLTH
jgi:hypothetical protein